MLLHEKENEEPLVVEKDNNSFSVIIVGGGPAGIGTSLTLSFRGISNCIIEAVSEPQQKYGEAIPPNAKPLFRQLGIEYLLKSEKHHPYFGNLSSWGSDLWEQKNFITEIHGHGYLLDRLYFENQLQELVKKSPVTFFSGYRLKHIIETDDTVKVSIQKRNEILEIFGQYVVDATGRKASVCRHFGVSKKELDKQFAITVTAILSNKIEYKILIEATPNGWWYVAPVSDNEATVMFFTLKDLLPLKEETLFFLEKELKSTKHLFKILKEVSFKKKELSIIPAGTSYLEVPYGKKWLAVGDAAYSYDPISSYGITSALASGYYGGHAMADLLSGKENALNTYRFIVEKAFIDYMQKLKTHYQAEKRWKDSLYWTKRAESYIYSEI